MLCKYAANALCNTYNVKLSSSLTRVWLPGAQPVAVHSGGELLLARFTNQRPFAGTKECATCPGTTANTIQLLVVIALVVAYAFLMSSG